MMTRKQIKEEAARDAKFVEWSNEDYRFIGRCPEIMAGGVHGSDEARVQTGRTQRECSSVDSEFHCEENLPEAPTCLIGNDPRDNEVPGRRNFEP